MIEELSDLPPGTLGFKATGKIDDDDYEDVITPAVEKAIETHDHIKLLVQIGPDFEGYSRDAVLEDAKLGLRHWNGFERIAVAADDKWVRAAVKTIGFMMPCPIQMFKLSEVDDAKRWLAESLGSIHLSEADGVITATLLGKLEPSAYSGLDDDIDGLMSKSEHVRLLLDLREFDGWSGLPALGNHLSLIREHRKVPERIAVVGDKAWQRMAEKIMAQFVNAKAHFFDGDDFEGAKAWVSH